jgi:hypothetical protein
MKRALPKNRTAIRTAKPRKPGRTAADPLAATRRQGARHVRPAAPPPVAQAVPAERTSSHDKPAAHHSSRYLPGRVLMQFAPWSLRLRHRERDAAGRLVAPGAGFDRAAQLHRSLFGEHAERLAALGAGEGVDS